MPPDLGKSCPSAPCAPGNSLLGVVGEDGRVHNLRTALTIDEGFVAAAQEAGRPEARMRFAGTCVTSGCKQWTGSRCGVIDRVLGHIEAELDTLRQADLPPCTIRGTCRWFGQSGADACAACPIVVTDARA